MNPKQYNIEGRIIQEDKLLSEGGYGYIWRAVDTRTREVFALKKSYCQGEERTQIAKNELNVMRRLPKHPNIVNFIGGTCIQENGQMVCLIILEFCTGGSIFDLMARDPNSRLPEQMILGYLKEIVQGLKAMHSLQPPMAHRDIKIENVLFSQDGRCKLCDFGSASTQRVDFSQVAQSDFPQYEDEFEKRTTLMYRPPEMVDLYQRYEVTEKVDVWMLGCVLYTICFYIHPFQESSKLAIATATYSIPKGSIYTDKLLDLIRLMLTPNPKLRPGIREIEQILQQFNVLQVIKLNNQAIEIKNREYKLQQEMEQFDKNSHKVKKFDGDIPMEELMKLQSKIKGDTRQDPHQKHQQHRGLSQQQQLSYGAQQGQQQQQFQQKQQYQQYQQQQQYKQSYTQQQPFQQFNQQPQQAVQPTSPFQNWPSQNNNQFDSNQKQQHGDIWNTFSNSPFSNNGLYNDASNTSQNSLGWDQVQFAPQHQPQQSANSTVSQQQWDIGTTETSSRTQLSTQASMNQWDFHQPPQVQQLQHSHSQPAQQYPQLVDLIGIDDIQESKTGQIDISNIIL